MLILRPVNKLIKRLSVKMDDCFIKIAKIIGVVPSKYHNNNQHLRIAQNIVVTVSWIVLTVVMGVQLYNLNLVSYRKYNSAN